MSRVYELGQAKTANMQFNPTLTYKLFTVEKRQKNTYCPYLPGIIAARRLQRMETEAIR